MSLQIYLKDDGQCPVDYIRDVEADFLIHPLQMDETALSILKDVEQATTFGDLILTRTGDIPITNISTGCKAALLVSAGHCIDACECGVNALYAILKHCHSGALYMEAPWEEIAGDRTAIDAILRDVHYTDLYELNAAFMEGV